MVSWGSQQERHPDASPGKPNPVFKPHPYAGLEPRLIPKLTADAIDTGVISRVFTIAGADAMKWSRSLAQEEGIFVDITAGGTFAGETEVCKSAKPGDTILAMLPDAGERYLSTPLFGDIGFDTNEEELKIFQLDAEPPHSAKGGLAGQQGRSGLDRGRSHCWLARACHHGTPRRHLRKCRVALTGAIVGVFWRLNQNILCRISGTICHCRLDHLYLCLALAPGLATLRTPP